MPQPTPPCPHLPDWFVFAPVASRFRISEKDKFVRSLIAPILMLLCILMLARVDAADSDEMLVLMHGSGKVERYSLASGNHLGTVLSGLPPSNAILFDSDGRLLISTGLPGGAGTVLRFDPRGDGLMETLLDIPEGYGGRLFRATGMTWYEGDLLVASQGDGKVKRYSYPSGEWKADSALASPGGITQIAIHDGRLFITDYVAQALRRASDKLDGSMSEIWAQRTPQAPWGLAFDTKGNAFWSTSANRILRFDGKETVEWAGLGGELNTPVGLTIGPDGLIYVANLNGTVSVWPSDRVSSSGPLRQLGGPEMKSPISFAFTSKSPTKEFAYTPPTKETADASEKLAFFEAKIRPLLIARCIECHGEASQEGGLRLDTRQAWERGGESGPAIHPGKPDDSLLIKAVQYTEKDLKMPPDKQLSMDEVALLTKWIRQGAIDPRRDAGSAVSPTSNTWAEEFQKRLDWWSLKPLANPAPPIVAENHWSDLPVDRFVLAALEQAKLKPAPAAEPEVLLRRVAIVLTGLPPTSAQRESFLEKWQVDRKVAMEQLIDEFLDSPHFGEHFARHWMDAVRYTDTYGYEWDVPAKGAHEYRDYLIRAFNGDVGFDVFLREQLAGDLLPQPRVDVDLGINESIIGPMFYHLGEHRHGSSLAYNGVHQEMVSNKIDAFSKVFLATTVACAKCHDHKLEAVSQKDYYALGAAFMTPRWVSRPADAPGKNDAAIAKLKDLRTAIRSEVAKLWQTVALQPSSWRALLEVPSATPPMPPPTIEDVAYPLAKLIAANTAANSEMESTWNALTAEWKAARDARIKGNESFQVLADLAQPHIPTGWVTDGDGMKHGWVDEATPLIALDGELVIQRLLPRGYHTHSLSSKLPGALRMPPEHLVPGQFVSLKLAGGEFGGYLQMDENAILNEAVSIVNQIQPTWRTIGDTPMKGGVTKVTIDFVTSSLNPNFPARVGVIPGLPNNDMGFDKRSWFSVTGIVTHDAGGTPQDTLDAFESLYANATPKNSDEINAIVTAWFNNAIHRWCNGQIRFGDRQIIDWLISHKLLPNQATANSPLSQLMSEYRAIEQTIAFPRSVNSMDEREVARSGLHLNIRGNYDALGDLVMPDSLQMFAGRNDVAKGTGSGRLELADSLLTPEHPLTSRVYVNRVWQWVFGTGLVTTPDDFGRLGDKPSHPELLDWLARDFVRNGWSTKKLIRQLLLTETFRQSGIGNEDAKQRDPANRLRHHYPTRRLEAESIRDAMLMVSGRLDGRLYGRSINPFRPAEDATKRLYSGPLDGDGRRSLYLTMSIMAPPKVLTTFDLPDLRLPSGRRNVTNVPSQSLMMLNEPLVSTLAKHWAMQIIKDPHTTVEERVTRMFLASYARSPSSQELLQWTAAVRSFATTVDIQHDEAAWTQLAHAIFNTQEFIHYR